MNDWSPVLGLPLWGWLFVLPLLVGLVCFIGGPRLHPALRPVWRVLDGVYFASGVVAAGFMLLILALIVAQMVARWTGANLPGTTEFAGYAMAGTSFFALSHALTRGAHIRVSILLNANRFFHKWLDIFALGCAAVIATYFARYAVKTNVLSEMLNDRTQGQDQIPEWVVTLFTLPGRAPSEWSAAMAEAGEGMVYTPVWIPQISMSVGTILLAIALWDMWYRLLVTGQNQIVSEGVE